EFGRPEFGWMCPSAPLKGPNRKLLSPWSGPPVVGEVYAAWGPIKTHEFFEPRAYELDLNAPEALIPRVGGYGFNWWLLYSWAFLDGFVDGVDKWPKVFLFPSEASITFPSLTPVLLDSVWFDIFPLATDLPASDLATGFPPDDQAGMTYMTIPR